MSQSSANMHVASSARAGDLRGKQKALSTCAPPLPSAPSEVSGVHVVPVAQSVPRIVHCGLHCPAGGSATPAPVTTHPPEGPHCASSLHSLRHVRT